MAGNSYLDKLEARRSKPAVQAAQKPPVQEVEVAPVVMPEDDAVEVSIDEVPQKKARKEQPRSSLKTSANVAQAKRAQESRIRGTRSGSTTKNNREIEQRKKEKEALEASFGKGSEGVTTCKMNTTLYNHVVKAMDERLNVPHGKIWHRTTSEFVMSVFLGTDAYIEDEAAKQWYEAFERNKESKDALSSDTRKLINSMNELLKIVKEQNELLLYYQNILLYTQRLMSPGEVEGIMRDAMPEDINDIKTIRDIVENSKAYYDEITDRKRWQQAYESRR